MLNSLRNLTRHLSTYYNITCQKQLPSTYPLKMSDMKIIKSRYDGRSKKRKWEERRSDKGERLGFNSKQMKVEDGDKTTEIKIEKIDDIKIEKIKRRKFVLLMGYSGVNYTGMQRNPGMKTIEEELFKALFNTGYIDEISFNQVQNMAFQRAARTDKGVSAVRQVVSLKLAENYDLSKINAQLPDEIRVFDCKRVTKGFNSKSQCDSRTYIYVLPTISFSKRSQEMEQKDFRLDVETLEKINKVLEMYRGTKNYHNYTSKKKPSDPSAKRYITSFVCEEPFVKDEVEFTILRVRGQSFMMHQIRKMVGMLLAVVRGLASEEIMLNSFSQETVSVPRAPGLGLILEHVHYDRYNNRYGDDGMHTKLQWDDLNDEINEFRDKYIFPTIINEEIQQKSMLYWIHEKLQRHSYDDTENNDSDDENCSRVTKNNEKQAAQS